MKKILLLSISLFLLANFSYSQKTLLLNSGKRIQIQDIQIIDSTGIVFYKTIKGKTKWYRVEDVFSWTREDSVEVIIYNPACKDACFRVEEMRDYIHGLADGKENYKSAVPFATGFIVGAGSGFILPPILSPLPPAGTSILFGAIKPRIKNFKIPTQYQNNKFYLEGFKNSVRRKRVIGSILGGAAGIVVGIVTGYLLKK